MTSVEFVQKWRSIALTERSACQQHFLDLCALVGHPTPAAVDATGESFCFERGAAKHGGGDGFADVWKKGFFGWEYKGPRHDLNVAYDQLLQYREALENPPLLIVSDMGRIEIRTNFTGSATAHYILTLDDPAPPSNTVNVSAPELAKRSSRKGIRRRASDAQFHRLDTPRGMEILHALFFDPEKLKPGVTSQAITQDAAQKIGVVARRLHARRCDPGEVARFLDRVVFAMFAEDIDLLGDELFTKILERSRREPKLFARLSGELFRAMADGGFFGIAEIAHFNGDLYIDATALDLEVEEIETLRAAARLDWSCVDPAIFGTLFERGLDPDTRASLGAHYTGREDIETLVEPVVMVPLRREWEEVRTRAEALLAEADITKAKSKTGKGGEKLRQDAARVVNEFRMRLGHVQVLDPACGSGNFLYVALLKLKDFEKEVIQWAMARNSGGGMPFVHPRQMHGIEVNPYAHMLAQMTVWIGYLQWTRANGYGVPSQPILERLSDNFRLADAVMDRSGPENPKEPDWPEVDYIVGNPPFLGTKLMRRQLGDDYVDALLALWKDRVPAEADLCVYWFEKARAHIEAGKVKRAGLLATQGIRGGANRKALERIKASGDIFFAIADRDWTLDGANVHISMVGFDDGTDKEHWLDGRFVPVVNSDLTARVADVTTAKFILENVGLAFMGTTKGGNFDIPIERAKEWLEQPNPHGRPNSDVLTPWMNGMDITRRSRDMWIVDFSGLREAEAGQYEKPFAYVEQNMKPMRMKNRRENYRTEWWRYAETRSGMYTALSPFPRFLVTARVSKHRLFVWRVLPTNPDSALIAFARDDDYFLGVMQSRWHVVWSLTQGTQLEDRPRYTPTSCFETFPFPWTPGRENIDSPAYKEIARAANELDALRERWLNPPEWLTAETLEFPGSVDGPWRRHIAEAEANGIGIVHYSRPVPRDEKSAAQLAKRTLTNLYNDNPAWLRQAHVRLDAAVAAAYRETTGDDAWTPDATDDDILTLLLGLQQQQQQYRFIPQK